MDTSISIMVLAVLIIMSGYFSATETAFSSLNRIRLKNLVSTGNKRAKLTLDLAEDYDKLLSTILIGNNIVNIGSASLATVIFVNAYGDAGVTIATVVMTILVLIFGEISPKSLAKEAPESFAMFSAPIIKILIFLLAPLNFFFMHWKKLLSKVIKVKNDRSITEEELLTIVDEAQHEGGIDEQDGALIRSAIEFNDLKVIDIFTPRVDVVAVSDEDGKEKIGQIFLESGYSRLPVFKEEIDNIIGVINQKDFHNYIIPTENEIKSIIKPVVFTTPSMKIAILLKQLQKTKSHIAVITDEYGGTMGIVTLEDIIEELVGDIWDEHDEVVQEFEKISEDEYRVFCSMELDRMFTLFHIDCGSNSKTVGGWVLQELGIIPNEGDGFVFEHLTIRVTKTDARRLIEIQVTVGNRKAGL